jgi:hypothetical protein
VPDARPGTCTIGDVKDQNTTEAAVGKKKDAKLEAMRTEAERRQDNLASDIDELVDRVNPKNVISRFVGGAVSTVKGLVRR